ncbi:hypothetical protein [Candidatus Albibeggiatoa sp. nov. NOAA]|uniref:hypothetical protein n=1 Tax=Candidatus Albibeggiatoa sp. nov. NOAA TaxID=3162724 RepID=UPI0032FD4BB6|nr:hypothetical protein [Thiotrichaceae bacterium]
MSKKSKKKKVIHKAQWRWQLDILLFLLTASIMLWTVVKVQLVDMNRIAQVYLAPIEEPQGLVVASQKRHWLEKEAAVINPLIKKQDEQPAETAQDIAEAQESTIIASVTEPKARKQIDTWREIQPKNVPAPAQPKPNYVTSTEKIDKKVALTPEDEIF